MSNVIEFPASDTCRRCGASMQATHHPLCEHRDGTPTELGDAEVRRRIREGTSFDDDPRPAA